jgi:hypothetical protein
MVDCHEHHDRAAHNVQRRNAGASKRRVRRRVNVHMFCFRDRGGCHSSMSLTLLLHAELELELAQSRLSQRYSGRSKRQPFIFAVALLDSRDTFP